MTEHSFGNVVVLILLSFFDNYDNEVRNNDHNNEKLRKTRTINIPDSESPEKRLNCVVFVAGV